jgi:hypothetical protein
MNKLTLASSFGAIWVILMVHFAAGLTALASGTVALATAKGGRLHKRSGIVFTWSMIVLGLLAAVMYIYKGQPWAGGAFVMYLVFTGMTAVKPVAGGRRLDVSLMLVAFVIAGLFSLGSWEAWHSPGYQVRGVPAGMITFLGIVALCAAVGDVRMIRAGGLAGTARIARHLWRMCFSMFIATGSFFLGQMKFIPEPMRILPLLMVLGIAPLPILLYWMWRVRLRKRLTGLMIST